jgi:hypothetical protein
MVTATFDLSWHYHLLSTTYPLQIQQCLRLKAILKDWKAQRAKGDRYSVAYVLCSCARRIRIARTEYPVLVQAPDRGVKFNPALGATDLGRRLKPHRYKYICGTLPSPNEFFWRGRQLNSVLDQPIGGSGNKLGVSVLRVQLRCLSKQLFTSIFVSGLRIEEHLGLNAFTFSPSTPGPFYTDL